MSGLPYAFIITTLCLSLWKAVKVSHGDLDPFGPTFAIGLFDCWGAQPLKSISKEFHTGMNNRYILYYFSKILHFGA